MLSKSSCLVCESPNAKLHFGAMSCRACAAFFRRCILTRKFMIFCDCKTRKSAPYPCRYCRMQKCLDAGMQASKIQGSRDVNLQLRTEFYEKSCQKTHIQIQCGIKLRSTNRIDLLSHNYCTLELTRTEILPKSDKSLNLHEFSLEVKTQAKLLWKFCEDSFLEFDELSKQEKKTIFSNFHSKWSIFEIAKKCAKFKNMFGIYAPSGSPTGSIENYYTNTNAGRQEVLTGEEKKRTFEPICTWRAQSIMRPLVALNFDGMESVALFGLLLWDSGYTNLSDDLAEKCRDMRKVMLKELSGYIEENDANEGRIFEVLDALRILEHAERKNIEELELCGMYNISVDEEMLAMTMAEKY